MVVCVLGALFNLANILVLSHKDMKSPVNMILTGIAVADCLVMLEYIPFTIHMRNLDDESIPFKEKVGRKRKVSPIRANPNIFSTLLPGASSWCSTSVSP